MQYIRAAIIADSGVGKTWFAGTWPSPGFIDADYKIRTLAQPEFKAKFGEKKVRYIQVGDPVNSKTFLFTEAKGYWQAIEQINKWAEDPTIETIVIDTLTSFSVLAMHVGLEVNQAMNRSKTLSQSGSRKVIIQTEADYGSEMNAVEQMMDQLVTLPKNIIVNCHTRPEYAENGGIKAIYPQITGRRTRAEFGRWFDEVWSLRIEGSGDKAKRVLYTRSDNLWVGLKTTIGLPPKIEEPTYEKIIAEVKKAQNALTKNP